MNCINDHTIQKYIDGELSLKKRVSVENHLAFCEVCTKKMEKQKLKVEKIKQAIRQLTNPDYRIPTLNLSPRVKERQNKTSKRTWYILSAACALLLLLSYSEKKFHKKPTQEVTIIRRSMEEIDANRPVTDQDMIITIVDPQGHVNRL